MGTVFLGGGTPNTYSPPDLTALLAHVRARFPGEADRETTIEVNPELTARGDLAAYVACGINRLSVGVQSFVPSETRTLGRRHCVDDVRAVVANARESGVRSVSVDLMFGIPGQSLETWQQSLEIAIALRVDHVSVYGLTIEPGTPFARWFAEAPAAFAGESLEADMYAAAIDALEADGFEHYEISNFARPGHRSAHNTNYWENGEYVGLGVGAASYRNGVRSTHTRRLDDYVRAVEQGREIPGQSECLEGVQRAGEAVMLALRTAQGVSFEGFKERYGMEFLHVYAPVIQEYRSAGLLDVDEAGARLTRRGRFLANEVCGAFVTFA